MNSGSEGFLMPVRWFDITADEGLQASGQAGNQTESTARQRNLDETDYCISAEVVLQLVEGCA